MLLRFGVENYRSIKERQELSLVASSLDDVSTGLITTPALPNARLLPAVIIYGANAAGKSNIVSAFNWMRNAVLFSHSRGQPGEALATSPFLLDEEWAANATTFDMDFISDDVRYKYGFTASKEAFVAEWLFAYPNDRRVVVFERHGLEVGPKKKMSRKNKVIAELLRPNSLYLSVAAQNNHEQLSKIGEFLKSIQIENRIGMHGGFVERDDLDSRAILFLGNIGTGVVSYKITEREKNQIFEDVSGALKPVLTKHLGDGYNHAEFERLIIFPFQISLAHLGSDERMVFLDFQSESDGTKRLLTLLSHAFRALDKGSVFISDELNASLHTQACEALVSLFASRETNPRGAQLIATTHDTNLLQSKSLRRDQVWFAEKTNEGATHIYPLTDIRTRKGDNLEKGYLQGRYGAVATTGSVKDIISAI